MRGPDRPGLADRPDLTDPELIDPRSDEQLDTTALEPYLRERLPEADGRLVVRQFGGGHANLTYLVAFGAREYVLRRPPLGPIAPSSHDMGREHRVLSRLYRHFDLAPRSFLHCEDESIIGAPFQVMERRGGRLIRTTLPEDVAGDEPLKQRIGEMLIDVLASLHALDREAVGLADLGHPDGFLQRQLEGWTGRWHAAAHEENPLMDRLVGWLAERRPRSRHASLIHNDYKLDNLLLAHDDPARAVAILDWDMCTSGDPLTDLGYLLNQWVEPGDAHDWTVTSSMPTDSPGFPTRDEAVERYARATGFDVDDVDWYFAFSTFKFAVIVQQIFIRFHRGQTLDERFAHYDERARAGIRKACAIAGL